MHQIFAQQEILGGKHAIPEKPAITSSELAALWITYQQKTMLLRMLEYFMEKADDKQARQIMADVSSKTNTYVAKIKALFQDEGAAIPVGFTAEDVNTTVQKLYDNGFDIMFLRLINEIGMAYREDIIMIFEDFTAISQSCYKACTQYLLEKGLIARSPYVSMPQTVEFVEDTNYLGGLSPFAQKRTLNTVEVAHLYHALSSNVTGMQMITGFAQCAQVPEVKKYFMEGTELAKSIIKEVSEVLIQSNVQIPSPSGGNATRSTAAPFSDKIMLYCVSLFCSFSIGGNSLGTALSMRNDLPAQITIFMKDVFEYAHKGAKIMIRNGWMEEPPQMEERKELMNV